MKTSDFLSRHRWGRVLLHVACGCKTRRWRHHWQGVAREFTAARPVADNNHSQSL